MLQKCRQTMILMCLMRPMRKGFLFLLYASPGEKAKTK